MSLTASRGSFKNQCADKHFSTDDGRRVRERQFALSCPRRSLVSRARFPGCNLPRTHSGIRQDALSVMANNPHMIGARADQRKVLRRAEKRRELTGKLQNGSMLSADPLSFIAHLCGQQTTVLPAKELHA